MQSLLSSALSNAVLAALLAAFVAVAARFCRRPAVRHALWLLVLLKLITPPLVPFAVTWPRSDEREPLPVDTSPPAVIFLEAAEITASGRRQPADSPPPAVSWPEENQPVDVGRSPRLLVDWWLPALVVLWLGGALAWWTVAAVRLRKFRRLLRKAQPATTDVQEQARRLAALLRLRRCPPIVFVSAPLSPMLWALGWSPRLLVPAELWYKLAAEQQDTLLAHELAHLRRGDHWVRRLELLVLGLYWWHPVVWWARRRLQEAEEECCDALVVAVLPDAAPAYASALVETVAFLSHTRPAALIGASGAGQVPLLKRRLTMILMDSSSCKSSRVGFWIVLGLGALLLPVAPQAARTEALEEPQGAETKGQVVALDFGFPINDRHTEHPSDEMRACLSCHQAPVHASGFHGKPQSWREAHDQIVHLMDELKRREANIRNLAVRLPAAAEPDHGKEVEKLQDEIELLKVQVRLKEARLAGAKAMLVEYKRRLDSSEATNKRRPGSIPLDSIMETRLAATTQEAQVQINAAELQEPLIRLKQAERRLARLQQPQQTRLMPDVRFEVPGSTSWNITWSEAMFINNRKADLGSVGRGLIHHDFQMANHGQQPIHIASVRTSDGCLSAVASKVDLAHGESAAIQTTLDTRRFVGNKTIQIYVEFDKPDRQQVVLEVQANSLEVQATPPATTDSGTKNPPRLPPPVKTQSPERLQELEKKLDDLRKEMDNLRREMRPDKPRDPRLLPDHGQR